MFRFWSKRKPLVLSTLSPELTRGCGSFCTKEEYYRPQWELWDAYWQGAADLLRRRDDKHEIVLPLLTKAAYDDRKYEVCIRHAILREETFPLGLWQLPNLRPTSDTYLTVCQDGGSWYVTARQGFRWRVADIPAHLACQAARVAQYGRRMSDTDDPVEGVWYRGYRERCNADAPVKLSDEVYEEHIQAQQRLAERVAAKFREYKIDKWWEVPQWFPKS